MKDFFRYKDFWGSVEVSIKDNCLHGKLLFIDDLVTYEAESVPQLQKEFEAAVDDYVATCQELGRAPQKPFSGTFNVRIGADLHEKLAKYAALQETSINDVVKRVLNEMLSGPEKPRAVDMQ